MLEICLIVNCITLVTFRIRLKTWPKTIIWFLRSAKQVHGYDTKQEAFTRDENMHIKFYACVYDGY